MVLVPANNAVMSARKTATPVGLLAQFSGLIVSWCALMNGPNNDSLDGTAPLGGVERGDRVLSFAKSSSARHD
jgi:hypothetical protein